jgi:hypothetical protein
MLYQKATRTTRKSGKDMEFPDSINGIWYIYIWLYIYIYDYIYIFIYDYIFFRQRRRTIAGFDMVFLSRLPTKTDNNTVYKVPYHFYPKKKTEVCTSQGTFSHFFSVKPRKFTSFHHFSHFFLLKPRKKPWIHRCFPVLWPHLLRRRDSPAEEGPSGPSGCMADGRAATAARAWQPPAGRWLAKYQLL